MVIMEASSIDGDKDDMTDKQVEGHDDRDDHDHDGDEVPYHDADNHDQDHDHYMMTMNQSPVQVESLMTTSSVSLLTLPSPSRRAPLSA